jgi:adenosylmethionine-8-amino-7-oxononanoate aminotransferase
MVTKETVIEGEGIPAHLLASYGTSNNGAAKGTATSRSALLYRNIHNPPRQVIASEGNYLTLSNGQKILDATCGAAVSCLGHGNQGVKDAVMKQMDQVAYCLSIEFGTRAAELLAQELREGTDDHMKKAYVVNSGKSQSRLVLRI